MDSSVLLNQLENLAALTDRNGLLEIKPFRTWKGNKYWSNAIFTMRLCNAGEVLEISSYSDQFTQDAKEKVIKIDTVIRSLYEINGIGIISPEELSKYNQNHNANLTRIERLRIWAKDLEQLVIDVLYTTYIGLQLKQVRLVTDQVMCESCGSYHEKEKLPEGSKYIKYSVGEMVCSECLKTVSSDEFDFLEGTKVEPNQSKSEEDKVSEQVVYKEEAPYICVCKSEFSTLEEFTSHRVSCPEANK